VRDQAASRLRALAEAFEALRQPRPADGKSSAQRIASGRADHRVIEANLDGGDLPPSAVPAFRNAALRAPLSRSTASRREAGKRKRARSLTSGKVLVAWLGRIGRMRHFRNREVLWPTVGKGWNLHFRQGNHTMNPPVVSEPHHRVATRNHGAIRTDDRPTRTHDTLEHKEATRQDSAATGEVLMESCDLRRDSGIAGEDLAVTPDRGIWSKAASQHPLSALSIVVCKSFISDCKHFENCRIIRCRLQ